MPGTGVLEQGDKPSVPSVLYTGISAADNARQHNGNVYNSGYITAIWQTSNDSDRPNLSIHTPQKEVR